MKHLTITIMLTTLVHFSGTAQESYPKAWNFGIGAGGYSGYYGYVGRSLPVFHVDYELAVVKSFTLGPSINLYSFSNNYYWGDLNTPPKYYGYRQTVVTAGVKGFYYFDDLLNASDRWDFYLAGSLGLSLVNSRWDDGYNGDKNYYKGPSSLFLDLHIGVEYHFYSRLGTFLDLSSGVSTIGLAIHSK